METIVPELCEKFLQYNPNKDTQDFLLYLMECEINFMSENATYNARAELYAIMFLLHIKTETDIEGEYLWKRIPQPIKEVPLLKSLYKIILFNNRENYTEALSLLLSLTNDQFIELFNDTIYYLRLRILNLKRKSYKSISIHKLSSSLLFNVDETIEFIKDKNWDMDEEYAFSRNIVKQPLYEDIKEILKDVDISNERIADIM